MNPALDNGPLTNGAQNDMVSKFQAFKQGLTGDPKAQVEALLSSGRMSQEQFNRFSQIANQLKGILR